MADHLVHPDFYLNKNNPEPLAWDRKSINQGLLLFYEHDLAYFRNHQVQASLTADNWVEKKSGQSFFTVLCPGNSRSVTFDINNINLNNLTLLPKKLDIIIQQHGKYHVTYLFHNTIKAMTFNIDHFTPSNKKNDQDLRQLLFHVDHIQCHESQK